MSNEIFYEIFDYLDGWNIHQIFSNLNYRFHELVNSSSLLFKITFYRSILKKSCQQILLKKNQILSIHFLSSVHHQLNIDSSFTRLESLTFDFIQPNILTSLLSKLTHLPRLFSLTIDTNKTVHDLSNIYRLIFHLSKLRYIRFFAMESTDTNVIVSLPINPNHQLINLTHLIIDHPCSFNELFSIVSYTSQLTRLSFIHKRNDNFEIDISSPIILTNLTHLSIYGDNLRFNQFQMFIRKIHGKFHVLSLHSLAKDITYLNGDRWKEFICKYLPQLNKFSFIFSTFFEFNQRIPMSINKLNTFNSLFWIETTMVITS